MFWVTKKQFKKMENELIAEINDLYSLTGNEIEEVKNKVENIEFFQKEYQNANGKTLLNLDQRVRNLEQKVAVLEPVVIDYLGKSSIEILDKAIRGLGYTKVEELTKKSEI